MSEFSESYHLRSNRMEDAVELLQRAKLRGYVYQPVNGWVTFLAQDGVFEPDQRIVDATTKPLLHYVSAEDHGWSFVLFNEGNIVCRYRCDWDDDIRFEDSEYSRAAIQQTVPSANPALLDELEPLLQPEDFDDLFETEPSKLLARALGLEHYDWLSYEYMEADFTESPEDYPEVTEVA
ncbi:MAG TPA: hypothetical protein VK815_01455 [Candidatus Acidoferrales bacterium]|jgi:hypothetical protein|nr:hypothetical protein [Candidatus Acidoferrales bacterium]